MNVIAKKYGYICTVFERNPVSLPVKAPVVDERCRYPIIPCINIDDAEKFINLTVEMIANQDKHASERMVKWYLFRDLWDEIVRSFGNVEPEILLMDCDYGIGIGWILDLEPPVLRMKLRLLVDENGEKLVFHKGEFVSEEKCQPKV